jgi:hypothetical protein
VQRIALAFLLGFRTYFSGICSILLAVNKRVLMHLTGEIEKQDSDLTKSSRSCRNFERTVQKIRLRNA